MDRIQKRFDELAALADQIEASKKKTAVQQEASVQYFNGPRQYETYHVPDLDWQLLVTWRTSALALLSRVFGEETPTYKQFAKLAEDWKGHNRQSYFDELRGVFRSAKMDFEGGYLFDLRNLVQAEVFSDELEQAEYFLEGNFKVPGAVIAGTVLESTLRTLCDANGISRQTTNGKEKMSNAMIDELAKASIFNKTRADLLRAWAKIRNSAAHGKPDEFDEGDVKSMIDGIRDFVANQLS